MPELRGVVEKLDTLLWGSYRSEDTAWPICPEMKMLARPRTDDLSTNMPEPGQLGPGRALQIAGVGMRYQFSAGLKGMLQDALRCTVMNIYVGDKPMFSFACGAFFPMGIGLAPEGKGGLWPAYDEMDPMFGEGYCRFYMLSRTIWVPERTRLDVSVYFMEPLLSKLKDIEEANDGSWAEITAYLAGDGVRDCA